MTQAATFAPKGQAFTRSLILRSMAKTADYETALGMAQARWGTPQASTVAKAAVQTVLSGDFGDGPVGEFFKLVMQNSLLGRLSGLRRVPFETRLLKVTSGASGYWVAESAPVPLSGLTLAGSSLRALKVAAIITATAEALKTGGPTAEAVFQSDLERAVIDTIDLALLDPNNAGVANERPPSLTYGAPEVTATSDASADVSALVDDFGGDIGAAYFVTDSETATRMALLRSDGAAVFPDVGARGGSVLGIPLLVSRASPRDSSGGQLTLIDPTGIAYGADRLELESVEQATIALEGEDEPEMVSLWQQNLVGFKAIMNANWEVQRVNSVAVITGIGWGA